MVSPDTPQSNGQSNHANGSQSIGAHDSEALDWVTLTDISNRLDDGLIFISMKSYIASLKQI
jgi:hypothetical protein